MSYTEKKKVVLIISKCPKQIVSAKLMHARSAAEDFLKFAALRRQFFLQTPL